MKNRFLKTLLLSVSLCSVGIVGENGYSTNNVNYTNEEIENALKQPSHLGLDNVGATCYMNATLQCLANCNSTSKNVLQLYQTGTLNDTKKYRLSNAYGEVLQNIYLPKDKTKKSYAPYTFKKVLGEMNSLFAPTAANDAKDLLIYFIEQLHTELNESKEKDLNLVMPDNMNPMDKQDVAKCFVNEFTKKYKSVFSDEYYGSNVSTTRCNGCGINKYSYQCYSFIIFPLLEAHKHYMMQNPYINNHILNLQDCFDYNQKMEYYTGNNQMYCNSNICQASKDASMQTRLSTAPNTLLLVLNRGKGNSDYKWPFTFWETIDLKDYVEYSDGNNKYYLSGVVSHMGDSGPSGHFIAFCRTSPDSKWYCYNDSIVSESSFQEINDRGTPYILFYSKEKNCNDMNVENDIKNLGNMFNDNMNNNMFPQNPMMFNNNINNNMFNQNQMMFNNNTNQHMTFNTFNNMNNNNGQVFNNMNVQQNINWNQINNMNMNNNNMINNNQNMRNNNGNNFNNINNNQINNMNMINNMNNNQNMIINFKNLNNANLYMDVQTLRSFINIKNQQNRPRNDTDEQQYQLTSLLLINEGYKELDYLNEYWERTNQLLQENIYLINNFDYTNNRNIYKEFDRAWNKVLTYLSNPKNKKNVLNNKQVINGLAELYQRVKLIKEQLLDLYNKNQIDFNNSNNKVLNMFNKKNNNFSNQNPNIINNNIINNHIGNINSNSNMINKINKMQTKTHKAGFIVQISNNNTDNNNKEVNNKSGVKYNTGIEGITIENVNKIVSEAKFKRYWEAAKKPEVNEILEILSYWFTNLNQNAMPLTFTKFNQLLQLSIQAQKCRKEILIKVSDINNNQNWDIISKYLNNFNQSNGSITGEQIAELCMKVWADVIAGLEKIEKNSKVQDAEKVMDLKTSIDNLKPFLDSLGFKFK